MDRYKQIEQTKKTYHAELPEPGDAWPPNVRRALNCKQDNLYAKKLSVGWMKEQCCITGKNFASRFKYYVGKTPSHYISHHRIEVAKQLLADPDLRNIKISTISYTLGYSEPAVFSNAFKRLTGMPPSSWRQGNG